MASSVKRQLSSLSEALSTAFKSANERFLLSMSVLMFPLVLRQREAFAAKTALKGLRIAVYIVVSFQRKLCGKLSITVRELALENFICYR